MNYVELHLGDWAKAVAHLTPAEEGVYLRLLRRYYADESPLPADVATCQRLAGARTPDERRAVVAVLAEFFVLDEGGHHNNRADEEIAKYREGEPEREAKRANERERQRRAREERRRLFDELRDRGVVPSYDTPTSELRRVLSQPVTRDITRTLDARPRDVTATQTPDTNTKKEQEHAAASPPPSPADADETLPANVTRIEPVCRIVLEAYHRRLPNCLPAHTLTPKRQRRILTANKLAKALIAQKGLGIGLAEFWDGYFAECAEDAWLRGDAPNPKNPRWRQNIDVLLAEDRFGGIMDAALARDLGSAA